MIIDFKNKPPTLFSTIKALTNCKTARLKKNPMKERNNLPTPFIGDF